MLKRGDLPDVSYEIAQQNAIIALAIRQLGHMIENVRKVAQP